jgi:ribosomal-protein-alanine N-acetyltransferase
MPATDVVIAAAGDADIDAIHQLESIAFPSPWRRDFFEGELHASGRLALTAKRDGQLVGYCFAMWFYDEMHVNKIAVDPSARRQGIAQELMRQCTLFAKSHGVKSISLEVRQSNDGAQDFYRYLHFAPLYVRPRYYPDGEAAVVMVLAVR